MVTTFVPFVNPYSAQQFCSRPHRVLSIRTASSALTAFHSPRPRAYPFLQKIKKIFSFIFVISIKHATILSSIATCPHFLFIVSEKEIENTFLHFPLDTFAILTSLKQKGYYSIARFKSYNILYF